MRLGSAVQIFAAVAFGLGFLAFGITSFMRLNSSEQRTEEKLREVEAGEIQPAALTVLKKYVNPGRRGLPHLVFSGAGQAKLDVTATKDFFNSVNLGDSVRAYYFPDGYFIPENQRESDRGGKWFLLGLGVFMGLAAFAAARAMIRLAAR